MEFFYDESGNPYAFSYKASAAATPVTYYYLTNLQGDVTAILDANGNVVSEYTYDAWGEIISATGDMAEVNPLRYRGYYYDAELEMYYLKSRYYDPGICRFINADGYASTGQGILGANMFAYSLNNSVNLVDRDGRDAGSLVAGWGASMWWLTLVDGPLPVGDIIYYGGLIAIGGFSLLGLDYLVSNPPTIIFAADEQENPEPELPDVEYPGDDPTIAPEGTEWKGKDEAGGKKGNYYNPETGESWHPDLDHPKPVGPHWDYKDTSGQWWRIYKDIGPQMKIK